MTTNDEEVASIITSLRDHVQDDQATGDTRLDDLLAAILNVKLNLFPGWIDRRREIAGLYRHGLLEIPLVKLPPILMIQDISTCTKTTSSEPFTWKKWGLKYWSPDASLAGPASLMSGPLATQGTLSFSGFGDRLRRSSGG